jgi:hypothetical protein
MSATIALMLGYGVPITFDNYRRMEHAMSCHDVPYNPEERAEFESAIHEIANARRAARIRCHALGVKWERGEPKAKRSEASDLSAGLGV